MNNKAAIASLALDLKRIALASHRGSYKVAERFIQETDRWVREVDTADVPDYIQMLLTNMKRMLKNKDTGRVAEDSLMYSTLFQNYSLR